MIRLNLIIKAIKMRQKAEDDLLAIVMDLIKKKGKPCEVSFKETWTWVQKIEHLLSVVFVIISNFIIIYSCYLYIALIIKDHIIEKTIVI